MPLTVFISYVNEDWAIASALNNMLTSAFGSDVKVFIDKVTIQQGDNIQKAIEENLEKSDLLAIVSTGIERPSHDWAGFELGFFRRAKRDAPNAAKPLWGRVVTFCLAGQAPRPNAQDKYVQFDEKAPETPVQAEDGLFVWFKELHFEMTGKDLDLDRAQIDIYKRIISEFRTKASSVLMQRPKTIYKPQKQLLIRYNGNIDRCTPYLLSEDATVELRGGAGEVFGIPDNDSKPRSWQDFCKRFNEHPLASFWVESVVRALLGASTPGAETCYVISSADGNQLYRLLLTSITTYHNETVEAGIYLFKAFRKHDYGDPKTTLLAKGLQVVTRFRSLFLEENSPFDYLNVALETNGSALAAQAMTLVYELDLLNCDIIEAKLDTPAAWKPILDSDNMEKYASVWGPLKAELLSNCFAAFAAADAPALDPARADLAATLKKISQQIGPINDETLVAFADRLLLVANHREGLAATPSAIQPFQPLTHDVVSGSR